jgi:hypothetical protein
MSTNHHVLSTAVAAIAVIGAGTAIVATPTAAGAREPGIREICPAVDTVPICDIVHQRNQSGTDGSEVARRPAPADNTTVWNLDTKDHPGYWPVDPADGTAHAIEVAGFDCAGRPSGPIVALPGVRRPPEPGPSGRVVVTVEQTTRVSRDERLTSNTRETTS